MQQIKCASCGSPDIEFLPGAYGRCRSCGGTFAESVVTSAPRPAPGMPPVYAPPSFPPPPPGMQTPPRSAGSAAIVVTIVFVVALAIIGAAAWGVMANSSPASSSRYLPAPAATVSESSGSSGSTPATPVPVTPATSRSSKVGTGKAEFRNVRTSTLLDGRFWVGSYVNTGTVPIGSPNVSVSLFDEKGKRVAEQAGYAAVDWLEPGESTVIMVYVSKCPPYAKAEVKVVGPKDVEYQRKPIALKILEWDTHAGGIGEVAVGTVKNTTAGDIQFAKIVVYGFDADDLPVNVSYSYATESDLAPGGESGFSVMISGLSVAKAVRYEILAVCSAK